MKLKKIFLVNAIFLGLLFGVTAETEKYNFNFFVQPIYEIGGGTYNEYSLYNGDKKEVSLDWQKNATSNLGVSVGAGWRFINLEGKLMFGLPANCGESTYLKANINKGESFYTKKLTYDDKTKLDMTFDGRIVFDFTVLELKHVSFAVKPYFGFKYNLLKIEANGARGAESPSSTYMYTDSGATLITKADNWNREYSRETMDFYLGSKVSATIIDRFTLTAFFGISPFTLVNAVDNCNENSSKYFLDVINSSFRKIDFGAEIDVKIIKGLSAGLTFDYNILPMVTGKTYSSTTNSNYKEDTNGYSSGTDAKEWKVGLCAKYTFGIWKRTITPKAEKNKNKINFKRYD